MSRRHPNRRFRSDERGSATVEFVLWLPVFVAILAFVTDTTMLMHQQSRLLDVARDATRQVSLNAMTEGEAETYARNAFGNRSHLAVDVSLSGGMVTTKITIPFREVLVFGKTFVGDNTLGASLTMIQEMAGGAAAMAGES
jgi:Flp pilus assembly protein TadG